MGSLVLAANPGSASRKYALYKKNKLIASIVFEHDDGQIAGVLKTKKQTIKLDGQIDHLSQAPEQLVGLLKKAKLVRRQSDIARIGLRVVAPSGYFLQDRLLDHASLGRLDDLEPIAPLHIKATLQEAKNLKKHLTDIPIILVSDSAFHADKPDYAWNYAIPLEDADRLEVKRFGYHGISVESVVDKLKAKNKLLPKMVICHLGSGASITALQKGKSLDNTMGYSPLEGMVMATRAGSIDAVAALVLKRALKYDIDRFEEYLNVSCGLKGVSGSSADIRELLTSESHGDYRAGLALRMYVYHAQQAIGQMAAVLNGIDGIVFTGTVGARSAIMRERIISKLEFLGLEVEKTKNDAAFEPLKITKINPRSRLKPVYVITTNEELEIANRALRHEVK